MNPRFASGMYSSPWTVSDDMRMRSCYHRAVSFADGRCLDCGASMEWMEDVLPLWTGLQERALGRLTGVEP